MKKVIIAGSRTFNDYNLLKNTMENLFSEDIIIVSGGAKGADSLGERYALEKGLIVEKYLANWKDTTVKPCIVRYNSYGAYNALAGHNRNRDMLNAVLNNEDKGMLVAFWDGKSSGTKNMIEIAEKAGVAVKVIYY